MLQLELLFRLEFCCFAAMHFCLYLTTPELGLAFKSKRLLPLSSETKFLTNPFSSLLSLNGSLSTVRRFFEDLSLLLGEFCLLSFQCTALWVEVFGNSVDATESRSSALETSELVSLAVFEERIAALRNGLRDDGDCKCFGGLLSMRVLTGLWNGEALCMVPLVLVFFLLCDEHEFDSSLRSESDTSL